MYKMNVEHMFKGVLFVEYMHNQHTIGFEVIYGECEELSRKFDTLEEVEYFIDMEVL